MALVALCGMMTGCAGATSFNAILEAENALRVERSQKPGSDFVVTLRTLFDPGYNSANRSDRLKVAKSAVEPSCPNARIVREDQFKTGETLIGVDRFVYTIEFKCGS
ncbi:hypothetical protein [Fulvimarina endophytica]|nr:hypothetical protein [Fulvimarina endophytica]